MTSSDDASATEGASTRTRVAAAKGVAVVLALFWGVLFFGLIDLLVVPTHDQRFNRFYLVETGWGLLYTVLVMLPLLLWAATPRGEVFLRQVLAAAASVLVCAFAALTFGQVVVAAVLAGSALAPAAVAGRALRWETPRMPWAGLSRWLGGLVVIALVAAVAYAVRMVHASYSGIPDDDTWGLMHLPMQAAMGLALAGSAAVSFLVAASAGPAWRLSLLPPAASAVWLGTVSMIYPHHLASLGISGGGAAVVWGIAFVGIALARRGTTPSSTTDRE